MIRLRLRLRARARADFCIELQIHHGPNSGPNQAETRRRYLRDAVRLREGPAAGAGACWLPWEVSESRYTSVQRGARALCVPFIIRRYLPAAPNLAVALTTNPAPNPNPNPGH